MRAIYIWADFFLGGGVGVGEGGLRLIFRAFLLIEGYFCTGSSPTSAPNGPGALHVTLDIGGWCGPGKLELAP